MSSRQGFPGVGLMAPSNCFGPTIDSITVNTINVAGTLTTKDMTVTGVISSGTIIETLIIQANIFEEFTSGAGITINSPMYLGRSGIQSRHTVYDVSGSSATGFVNVVGSSSTYDSALRYTNTAAGAFIFESSAIPYMTLYNDAGTGKMLVDKIAPNATTNVNIANIVVGPNTTNTPGSIRYNANTIEVCNNLGVWGPIGGGGTVYTGGANIDVTGSVISLVASPSVTSITTSGDVLVGGNLSVTGTSTMTGQVNVNGGLVANAISSTGNISAPTMSTTGAVTVGGLLTGSAGLSTTTISASGGISSTTTITAGTTLSGGSLSITNNGTISGTLTVTGTLNANGGISTTTVTASSALNSNRLTVSDTTNTANIIMSKLANSGTADSSFNISASRGVVTNNTDDVVVRMGMYYGTTPAAMIDFHRGGSATDGYISFFTNGSRRMTVSNSGNVEINSTGSMVPFSIVDSTLIGGGVKNMIMGLSNSLNNSGAIRYSHSGAGFLSNRLSLGLVGSEDTLSITGNGFVGIRNNAPSSALDVTGQIRGTSAIIPLVLSNVTFSQNSDTPANATYNFFNATPGNQTGGLTINPWVDGRCLINLVGNGPHDFRSRINSTDDNIFMQVTNDGVNHRFMNVSTTLSPTPVLGSFGSDSLGYMRYYTGSIWKFLTPMDLTTRRGEMNGITSNASAFDVILPGTAAVSICPNGTATAALTITADSTFAGSGFSQIENKAGAFFWQQRIDGNPQYVMTMSNLGGMLFDYMAVGTSTVVNPGGGQLKYDSSEAALSLYDTIGWKKITAGVVGFIRVSFTTGATVGDGITVGVIEGPYGVITGVTTPGSRVDVAHNDINGTYRGYSQIAVHTASTPRIFLLYYWPASSTSNSMTFRLGVGTQLFDMIGPSAYVFVDFYISMMSY